MSTGANLDTVEAARGGDATAAAATAAVASDGSKQSSEKETGVVAADQTEDFAIDSKSGDGAMRGPNGEEYPTAKELETLRRVKGPITWVIYTVAFIELIERFAWYGTTAVCM